MVVVRKLVVVLMVDRGLGRWWDGGGDGDADADGFVAIMAIILLGF
ncbi:hypothetical protein Hanom_Chr12g01094211 [Helianthus anomalus]